jgi:uncharacterized protein YecT (DUF1311 family)
MKKRQTWWMLAVGAVLVSPPAWAEGPAFDCSKADGEVEELICQDESLAALDRKLAEVYEAALAKARDEMPRILKTEQRGWIKGRNDCWKARGEDDPVFLTASWRATSVKECVEGQYRIRTSELQALYRLAPMKGPVFYGCESNPANEVVATFFETDPPTARLERGDRAVTAWLVPAGSGSKYEGQNLEFWTKGDEATVTWLDEELKCTVKDSR